MREGWRVDLRAYGTGGAGPSPVHALQRTEAWIGYQEPIVYKLKYRSELGMRWFGRGQKKAERRVFSQPTPGGGVCRRVLEHSSPCVNTGLLGAIARIAAIEASPGPMCYDWRANQEIFAACRILSRCPAEAWLAACHAPACVANSGAAFARKPLLRSRASPWSLWKLSSVCSDWRRKTFG